MIEGGYKLFGLTVSKLRHFSFLGNQFCKRSSGYTAKSAKYDECSFSTLGRCSSGSILLSLDPRPDEKPDDQI